MFVGHYGPVFVAKRMRKSIPLWVLFVAAQLLDIVWCMLVLGGIDKVHILHGFAPIDPYYMPYDHGLDAAILWSLLAGLAYWAVRRDSGKIPAVWVGLIVFSHWVLDFITHRPDLPLIGNAFKVGLGLWSYQGISLVAEIVVLFGGLYFYLNDTHLVIGRRRYLAVLFGLVMLAIHMAMFLGPPPPSVNIAAAAGLVCYVGFAVIAYWLDRKPAITPINEQLC